IVNIHPSLLPSYPGKNTHEKVFNAGNKIHGISIHFVVPEVDAGPIVAQAAMRVYQEDTPSSLESRIHKLEHWLYPKVVSWIIEGKVHVNDQGKVDIPFCTGFFMDD
ncbi:phosphoribosylglycinamide formyltransferase, partial [Candidatus Ichthyocystis hellenicum]